MAAVPAAPPQVLIDRADIHKSCKTLENIVNVFAEYSHAASDMVATQKKLAKALREAAGLKFTGEIAINAMNASAGVFEVLADVDAKFVKFAERECEGISNELRKWFKKLAKEEKSHDERIASANAKIKQAGQAYEKKAKKNNRDAVEEHARYVNLLNTMGPDMSQEKYNHALLVTQRHTSAVYSVAGCLSRLADAEWLSACEGVRRFSPVIGQLGEWRVLCEGGWTGPVPPDLPGDSTPSGQPPVYAPSQTTVDLEEQRARVESLDKIAPEVGLPVVKPITPSVESPVSQSAPPLHTSPTRSNSVSAQSSAHSQNQQLSPSSETEKSLRNRDENRNASAASLASLAAFPSPPTHFPLPNVPGARPLPNAPDTTSKLPPEAQPGSNDGASGSQSDRTLETSRHADNTKFSPSPGDEPIIPAPITSPSSSPAVASQDTVATYSNSDERGDFRTRSPLPQIPPQSFVSRDRGFDGEVPQMLSNDTGASSGSVYNRGEFGRGDYLDDREFGVERKPYGQGQVHARTYDHGAARGVERMDSSTSRPNYVASMKDRFGRATGPSSPPPRDIPRLPQSVSELANRYQPLETTQLPSHASPTSPTLDRYQTTSGTADRYRMPEPGMAFNPSSSALQSSDEMDDVARRRQRIEELKELELKEQEHELREREREIELRARELERERARINNARMGERDGYTSDAARRSPAAQRIPLASTSPSRPESQYSQYSYNAPPRDSAASIQQPLDHYPFPQTQSPQQQPQARPPSAQSRPRRTSQGVPPDHAPYCGCQACSIARYKPGNTAPASAHDLRPPEKPIALRAEKPKSWMRRLSMPVVGGAFTSDTKKSSYGGAIAGGIGAGSRNSLVLPDEDGRIATRSWERDSTGGISNRSVTNFAQR